MAVGRLVGPMLAASLGLLLVGCSHRTPGACTVTCADDSLCPEGTTCGGDGFCHAADQGSLCEAIVDPPDGAPSGDDGGDHSDASDPVPDADPCEGVPNRDGDYDTQDRFIPDDNLAGINLTLSLDRECVTVETVEVYVEIIHEYRGDVEIRLTSPAGDTALLLDSSNDSTQNIFATFDVPIAEGESAAGEWVLNVRDVVADLVGTVDYWSIGINRAAP